MGHKLELGQLKKKEVGYADITIKKAMQFSAYTEEILALKNKRVIRNSFIKNYRQFLDNYGLCKLEEDYAAVTYTLHSIRFILLFFQGSIR